MADMRDACSLQLFSCMALYSTCGTHTWGSAASLARGVFPSFMQWLTTPHRRQLKLSKVLEQLRTIGAFHLVRVQSTAGLRLLLNGLHGVHSDLSDGLGEAAEECDAVAPDVMHSVAARLTSGERTVEMVGRKEMADWKRLKMTRAASYSVFSSSSAIVEACRSRGCLKLHSFWDAMSLCDWTQSCLLVPEMELTRAKVILAFCVSVMEATNFLRWSLCSCDLPFSPTTTISFVRSSADPTKEVVRQYVALATRA